MGNKASFASRALKKEREEARQKTMKAAAATVASAVVKAYAPPISSSVTSVVISQPKNSVMDVHSRLAESLNRDGKEFIKQELVAMYCLMSRTPLSQAEDAAKALTVVELRAAIRLMVAGAIAQNANNNSGDDGGSETMHLSLTSR